MSLYRLFDPDYIQRRVCADQNKFVLIMVGLPARGKSYISKKMEFYLKWLGLRARSFNVGNQRRQTAIQSAQTSDFFDAGNASAKGIREQIAMSVLDDLLAWLTADGDLAIFDATNTTRARRDALLARIKDYSPNLTVLFIESICDDPNVLESNFMQKIANSPDYRSMPPEDAIRDLRMRIANYERVYEPIADDTKSYIKLINLQSKMIANRVYGRLGHSIANFLMGLNIVKRKVILARCGNTEGMSDFNEFIIANQLESSKSGCLTLNGNNERDFGKVESHDGMKTKPLDKKGRAFSRNLKTFVEREIANPQERLVVYTSTAQRAIQTAADIPSVGTAAWPALNMLDTGMLDEMTFYRICHENPKILQEFMQDPFKYRIPGGESFEDVVRRLDDMVVEIERLTQDVLIVSHLTTLQVLYGYFKGIPGDKFCSIAFPQKEIIVLSPNQYGWDETRIDITKGDYNE